MTHEELKERFIELLKAADEYSAQRCITDYDEAIADNAEYLIAHGATVESPVTIHMEPLHIAENVSEKLSESLPTRRERILYEN